MTHTIAFALPGFWECVVIFVILAVLVLPAVLGGSIAWMRIRDKMKGPRHGDPKDPDARR